MGAGRNRVAGVGLELKGLAERRLGLVDLGNLLIKSGGVKLVLPVDVSCLGDDIVTRQGVGLVFNLIGKLLVTELL